jgi:hypothetical protein
MGLIRCIRHHTLQTVADGLFKERTLLPKQSRDWCHHVLIGYETETGERKKKGKAQRKRGWRWWWFIALDEKNGVCVCVCVCSPPTGRDFSTRDDDKRRCRASNERGADCCTVNGRDRLPPSACRWRVQHVIVHAHLFFSRLIFSSLSLYFILFYFIFPLSFFTLFLIYVLALLRKKTQEV